MEKAKPSKKKGYYNNRNRDAESYTVKHIDWRKVGKKNTGPSEEELLAESQKEKYFAKRPLQQPKSRLFDVDEIWQETNVGQNFETLLNAPVTSGGFVFKSEKNWNLDTANCGEFFSIDVKNLAAIINCIPYNQLVDVDDKYFTKDELTHINNSAEKAKKAYEDSLMSLENDECTTESDSQLLASGEKDGDSDADQSSRTTRLTDEINPETRTAEDDLDFLLSLKEPVRPQSIAASVASPAIIGSDGLKPKSTPAVTKSIDLEKWLDAVLDD